MYFSPSLRAVWWKVHDDDEQNTGGFIMELLSRRGNQLLNIDCIQIITDTVKYECCGNIWQGKITWSGS